MGARVIRVLFIVMLVVGCVPDDGLNCSTPDVVEFPDGGISAMTCERE